MTDKIIDEILKEVYSVEIYELKQLYDFNNNQDDYRYYRRTISVRMKDELNLVLNLAGSKIVLSHKGQKISENGGWLSYVNSEKTRDKKIEDKLDYDLKISRIKSKTFVPILWLGAIGGVYSLIKLLILGWSLIFPKGTPQTTKRQQTQSETKYNEPLNLQSLDSLHNSNLEIDFSKNGELLDSLTKK